MHFTRNFITIMSLMAVLASGAMAQQCLSTPMLGGNGAQGAMFDVGATGSSAVILTDLSVSLASLQGEQVPYEVYMVSNGTTHVGKEGSSANWTLIRSGTVTASVPGTATALNLGLGIFLQPGQSLGLYVTTTSPSHTIVYSNGSVLGNPIVTSGEVTVFEGSGANYPFTAIASPRAFNGVVHYSVSGLPAEYQMNQPGASLSINNVESNGCTPAITNVCSNGSLFYKYRTNESNRGFELAITGAAPLGASQGAVVSASGNQILNLDFSATYFFLMGGSNFQFVPILGDWDLPTIAPTQPGVVTQQAYQIAPSSFEGFAVSQAAQVDTILAGPVVGPTFEDGVTTIDLGSAPLCFGPGAVEFYGTTYDTIHVAANGRILFGAPDADPTPSPSEALLDAPFIGAWADFSPVSGGSIQVSASGNGLRVDWLEVPTFGSNTGSSWAITYDATDHRFRIEGVNNFVAGSTQMFLGLSAGSTGSATDSGAVSYANFGGSAANATDMLYEFGTVGRLASGISALTFIPDGFGNYVWLAN